MSGTTRLRVGSSPRAIRVAERALRRDTITDQLLELLELGKPPGVGTGPDRLVVERDLEDPLGARAEGDLGELALERHEQLLRHPRRAEQPATARAVRDPDGSHSPARYGLICTGVPSGTACQISSISW